eukprot:s45_g45.t1
MIVRISIIHKDHSQRRPFSLSTVKKAVRGGRHLVFKRRKLTGESGTRAYAVLPLPPKVATKGSCAVAETLLEVARGVKQKLLPGKHIAAADGSPALQKTAALAKTPSLQGVAHLRFTFTPLATLAKKGLPQEYVNLLRKLVKDRMAKEKKDCFILAAGDQVAEGIASVSKGQLRRMGLLSRSARDKIEHRNILCAHYLSKEPGLERILRALALHRTKASNGLAPPSQRFDKPLWDM